MTDTGVIEIDLTSSAGTMFLPSVTAIALWNAELLGQFSDGMWENASPRTHWRFWHALNVVNGSPAGVVLNPSRDFSLQCRKNSYNFAGLYEILGHRMLTYGRAAKAGADPWDCHLLRAFEYVPDTYELFTSRRLELTSEDGTYRFGSYPERCILQISQELAKSFYETVYTMKEMRFDIKLIKSAMKTVVI